MVSIDKQHGLDNIEVVESLVDFDAQFSETTGGIGRQPLFSGINDILRAKVAAQLSEQSAFAKKKNSKS